jgi:hypothetical protein
MYVYTSEQEIEDFLKEYQRSKVVIITTVRATLNRAVEFEYKFNKPFYQFTTDEALEMYESIHTISVVSLQNSNLVLKHATRWFRHQYNKEISDTYETMTKEQLSTVVDTEKQRSMILSREDVDDIQSNLLNATDRAIVEMLFQGVGGESLKELTFMDASNVDRKNSRLYFRTGKTIPITDDICNLLMEAFAEDELASFGSTSRVSKVSGNGLYKIRCNVLSTNANPNDKSDVERRYRWTQRRLMLISNDLGINLTSGGISASGLLWHIQQKINELGCDFREFVKTNTAKQLAQRYGIRSEFYGQILLEKFDIYFN